MANKRSLKKAIRHICGDIAGECIIAKNFIPGVDKAKLNDCIIKVAELQTTALARTNVSFTKVPRDYDSLAAYAKERREYYAKAYKALHDGFNNQVIEIVKEMNAALPAKK